MTTVVAYIFSLKFGKYNITSITSSGSYTVNIRLYVNENRMFLNMRSFNTSLFKKQCKTKKIRQEFIPKVFPLNVLLQ